MVGVIVMSDKKNPQKIWQCHGLSVNLQPKKNTTKNLRHIRYGKNTFSKRAFGLH